MKRFSAIGAVIALTLSASTALATPSTVTPGPSARGTSAAAYDITAAAGNQVATQTATFAAGGTSTSGWHTHPGRVVTIVKSGTMSIWFSDTCTKMTFRAGDAIVVPGTPTYDLARNESLTEPLVLVQTYFNVPVGAPLRTEDTPKCSGTGVPQDMGALGITPELHARVTVASAINITGSAGTDLVIQQLTWNEGATTGWHSHPGQVAVLMAMNELTYVHADCTQVPYPEGTGFIDPGVMVHKATNDGNGPVIAFATFTNVPKNGPARIDAADPSGDECGQNDQSGIDEPWGDNNGGGANGQGD